MQVLSAPSSARTFWFVNTAGAVPGKASVARNIARSSSLREPGFLVIVAPFSNRGPSGVTGGLRYLCNGSQSSGAMLGRRLTRRTLEGTVCLECALFLIEASGVKAWAQYTRRVRPVDKKPCSTPEANSDMRARPTALSSQHAAEKQHRRLRIGCVKKRRRSATWKTCSIFHKAIAARLIRSLTTSATAALSMTCCRGASGTACR
jgi:hypothetical protein